MLDVLSSSSMSTNSFTTSSTRRNQRAKLRVALAVSGSRVSEKELSDTVEVLTQSWPVVVQVEVDSVCHAQTAVQRAHHLYRVLCDEGVDLIWFLRGGEGSADILPHLHQYQAHLSSLKPKALLGLSDCTAVLLYMAQYYGWPTTYGMGAVGAAKPQGLDAASLKCFREWIEGNTTGLLEDLVPLNSSALLCQGLAASVCVGNLTLLALSIKDLWEFRAENKLLMVEDWHEAPYAVHRLLKYLGRVSQLDHIQGLIVGDFCADVDRLGATEALRFKQQMQERLEYFSKEQSFPVWQTTSVGHGPRQVPITMNVPVRLYRQAAQFFLELTYDHPWAINRI